MKKENGIYCDFYCHKDGMDFPLKTLNVRELSNVLITGVLDSLGKIIDEREKKESK